MKTIKDYLDGKLSPEDNERATHQLFREKFSPERKKLQQKWATQLEEQHQLTRKVQKPLLRRLSPWMAVAASVLLLVFLAQSWLSDSNSFDQQLEISLLHQHDESTTRKDSQASMEDLEVQARAAYNEKDFVRATQLWETLVTQNPNEATFGFFHGLSLLYQQPPQAKQAVEIFEEILPNAGHRLQEEIRWYLALALLKTEQTEKGQLILKQIIQQKQWQSDKAQQLLELMDKD